MKLRMLQNKSQENTGKESESEIISFTRNKNEEIIFEKPVFATIEVEKVSPVKSADENVRASEPVIPPIATIHATAVIEDSPNFNLDNEELESLQRFIASKEHLVRNVANLEFKYLSSREFRSNKFKHTIEVKIHVKTENLWEGARNYIWKHLGDENTWSRGNGSRITLVRRHQK